MAGVTPFSDIIVRTNFASHAKMGMLPIYVLSVIGIRCLMIRNQEYIRLLYKTSGVFSTIFLALFNVTKPI